MGEVDTGLISMLQSEIAGLSARISENIKKITRLQNAASEISSEQAVAMENKKWIQKPDFTDELWTGKHADMAMNLRELISQEYSYTFGYSVERILTDIEEKIRELEAENVILSASITAKRQRIQEILSR